MLPAADNNNKGAEVQAIVDAFVSKVELFKTAALDYQLTKKNTSAYFERIESEIALLKDGNQSSGEITITPLGGRPEILKGKRLDEIISAQERDAQYYATVESFCTWKGVDNQFIFTERTVCKDLSGKIVSDEPETKFISDGKILRMINAARKEFCIDAATLSIPTSSTTWESAFKSFDGTSLLKIFEGVSDDALDISKVDQLIRIISDLNVASAFGDDTIRVRTVLDIDAKTLLPILATRELGLPNGGLYIARQKMFSYQTVEGVTFPLAVEDKNYMLDASGMAQLENSTLLEIKKVELNFVLDPKQLKMEPPDGYTFVDSLTGEIFPVGRGKESLDNILKNAE